MKVAYDKAKEELKKLKSAETNIKKQREQAMREMEGQMKAAQKIVSSLKAEVAVLRGRRDALTAEVANNIREASSLKDQQSICKNGLLRMTEEAQALTDKVFFFFFFLLLHTHILFRTNKDKPFLFVF